MIHVWKLQTITLCNLVVDRVLHGDTTEVIEKEELRRRIHTFGREVTEPTICAKCYAAARPEEKR